MSPSSASQESTETHVHLAKDGLYYDDYTAMRAANKRLLDSRIAQLGLHEAKQDLRRAVDETKKKQRSAKKKKENVEMRRSKRVRNVKPDNEGLKNDDPWLAVSGGFFSSNPTKPKKKRRVILKNNSDAPIISDKDRQKLLGENNWLGEMRTYLLEVENLSDQNYRSVINQVEKLVAGLGIVSDLLLPSTIEGRSRVSANPLHVLDLLYLQHCRLTSAGTKACTSRRTSP